MRSLKCKFVRTFSIVVTMLVTNFIVIEAKTINETQIENLRSCLLIGGIDKKNIIFKSDSDVYNELNYQWNKRRGYIEPMAYVTVKTNSDIRTSIICCKLLNIRIVARGGGHSFDKRCFGDSRSLIVDMCAMKTISIDRSGMYYEVGAGARAALITYTLLTEGEYVAALGICPSVGITGLALGGGFGYFTRIFGLASDNLVELQMINANGNLLTINETTNGDLFWALRGGGGGSFGIVTKLKFKMYKAPKSVIYGNYFYDFDAFEQFYEAYQSLLSSPAIPNNFGLLTKIINGIIAMEVYVMNFENPETISVDINKVLASFSFPKATTSSLEVLSYSDFYMKTIRPYSPVKNLTQLSQLKEMDKHSPTAWMESKSMFVKKILDKNEISKLYGLLKPLLPYATLFFEHNGGAIDDHLRTDTAFVHRNNLYSVQVDTIFADFNFMAASTMKTFYDASKNLLNHQETYQNYVDPTMTDYLQRYYGENLEKLIKIKTKYDPDNVFSHQQSIPTAGRSVSIPFM